MHQFIERYSKSILGVLSGFDRLRLRGTIRQLAHSEGLSWFLRCADVLYKDYGRYVEEVSDCVKAAAVRLAERTDRPRQYLPGGGDKEAIARRMLKEHPVEQGLIGVLSAVENCRSYTVNRNRETKQIELQNTPRKCLHLYFYFLHSRFGFMHARLQTWFPFDLQICLNGREWLCRDLDRLGLGYRRRENCLIQVEDVQRAQTLLDRQLKLNWIKELDLIAATVHPVRRELAKAYPLEYYWTIDQSEWATDVMFSSPTTLAGIYSSLVEFAMKQFGSRDVMRFLGRKVPTQGFGRFQQDVISDVKHRPEGVRVKHSIGGNSIKMYDKQGSVLRTETTLNQPDDMKVYRTKEGDEQGSPEWLPLRKGVVDIERRAEICQRANERYLASLSAAVETTSVAELTTPVCQRVLYQGRSVRGLRPFEPQDAALLAAVHRGEFAINGFRNRDLQTHLYSQEAKTDAEQRRRSSAVTRQLRMLRAHGLIRKVPRTHRYQISDKGRTVITAILAVRHANPKTLTAV
jgi:hypothetical protein